MTYRHSKIKSAKDYVSSVSIFQGTQHIPQSCIYTPVDMKQANTHITSSFLHFHPVTHNKMKRHIGCNSKIVIDKVARQDAQGNVDNCFNTLTTAWSLDK